MQEKDATCFMMTVKIKEQKMKVKNLEEWFLHTTVTFFII